MRPAEIRAWRADNAARKAALGPGPEMHAVETFRLPGHAGVSFRVRRLVPSRTPHGTLVYLHGGGWVTGSIDTFDRLGRALAERSDWTVLLVDYAKAPERPYPAGLEDAWAAWQWAVANVAAPLVVGGDSSGGNLATIVARRARDAGVRIDGQVLIYPVTDSDTNRPSYRADAGGQAHIRAIWDLYCPPDLRRHPDVAPLRTPSLAALAPALVVQTEHDPLNSEVDAYAERLVADGVSVTRHHIPGLHHGCLSYWGTQPEADRAIDAIAAWLNRH